MFVYKTIVKFAQKYCYNYITVILHRLESSVLDTAQRMTIFTLEHATYKTRQTSWMRQLGWVGGGGKDMTIQITRYTQFLANQEQ